MCRVRLGCGLSVGHTRVSLVYICICLRIPTIFKSTKPNHNRNHTEEDMEDMAEPIVDFEHDGKTYTLMKFVQVQE